MSKEAEQFYMTWRMKLLKYKLLKELKDETK
jgi:hypothetical protein